MNPQRRYNDEDDNVIMQRRCQETNVTFGLWPVILLIITTVISLAVYSSSKILEHSDRLTKVETQFYFIAEKLNVIDQRLISQIEERRRK